MGRNPSQAGSEGSGFGELCPYRSRCQKAANLLKMRAALSGRLGPTEMPLALNRADPVDLPSRFHAFAAKTDGVSEFLHRLLLNTLLGEIGRPHNAGDALCQSL